VKNPNLVIKGTKSSWCH